MEIKHRTPAGRYLRRLARAAPAIAGWTTAVATTTTAALGLTPVVVADFAVGAAVAATVFYARRATEATTQAAFMAGVMHERATGDSYQLPDPLRLVSGNDTPVSLPAQRRRPRPNRRR
ncbi:hypothetical protein GCM10010399_43790 [Dactylosporangium fulvum]|uniref:Uncharacterized protein n=1 Tax=Dactylosporangium fulvum TaxID=53359 RepID=A0ABY5W9R0_9ACTN|nr:hypothetical protein [Dactylosporangium fulvum]UWP85954.1 hypothetical protein Dfulv_17545 [Dactylosporangium fulvum]